MRPGDAPAQRQRGVGVDRQNPVEARAQFAPGIGRIARGKGQGKAVGNGAELAVVRGVEALRLERRVGRDPDNGVAKR